MADKLKLHVKDRKKEEKKNWFTLTCVRGGDVILFNFVLSLPPGLPFPLGFPTAPSLQFWLVLPATAHLVFVSADLLYPIPASVLTRAGRTIWGVGGRTTMHCPHPYSHYRLIADSGEITLITIFANNIRKTYSVFLWILEELIRGLKHTRYLSHFGFPPYVFLSSQFNVSVLQQLHKFINHLTR